MEYDFDIVVIGAGAGGLFAVSVANGLGAKACLVEKKRLGGDCTWSGCMPSKALLKSAQTAHLLRRYPDFGLKIEGDFRLDSSGVMAHVRELVREISTHHPREVFEKRGIRVVLGAPKFIDKSAIEINGRRISAKRFIISTGSHPVIPHIEGLKDINYLTNENIFDLERLPKSLIVLGGGPIGVELSQALSRLGVETAIVEMMDRILFREDNEISEILARSLKKDGVRLLCSKKAVKFFQKENKIVVSLEAKDKTREEISADNVLVAVGRAPNIEGLELEKAGLEYTNNAIKVNDFLQTSNSNIFACGDVVGPYMFSHVAAYQAQVCARNALFKKAAWQRINYSNIAWAIFTEPELAHLGLTEEEAAKRYKSIKIYKTEYGASDRAVTDLEKEGLLKVITDRKGYILGAHIAGAQASEIIQGFLIAKALRHPLSRLSEVLFMYPTLSELIKKTAAKPLLERFDNPIVKFAIELLQKIKSG